MYTGIRQELYLVTQAKYFLSIYITINSKVYFTKVFPQDSLKLIISVNNPFSLEMKMQSVGPIQHIHSETDFMLLWFWL